MIGLALLIKYKCIDQSYFHSRIQKLIQKFYNSCKTAFSAERSQLYFRKRLQTFSLKLKDIFTWQCQVLSIESIEHRELAICQF